MKTLINLLLALLVLVLLGIGLVYSGVYDIGADDPHTRPVHALLELARERSIAMRAKDIAAPDLEDAALIRAGAGNYDSMCVGCHLAPGVGETEMSKGLYPAPPNLAEHGVRDPAAAYWVIKHGIKASGMPAWGKSMDDEYIWGMVAFLRKLPQMNAEQYRAEVAASGGHSHGGGETMGHEEGETGGHSHGGDEKDAEDGQQEGDHGPSGHHHQPAEPQGETHTHADGRQHVHAAAVAADTPVAAAQALHAALSSGDAAKVEALLDPEVLILESGGAERSRTEYASHHMQADMAFLKDAGYELLRQTGDTVGDLAWVASESRIATKTDGKATDVLSTETLVLKKSADAWKIVHVHWSSRPAAR